VIAFAPPALGPTRAQKLAFSMQIFGVSFAQINLWTNLPHDPDPVSTTCPMLAKGAQI
jgi:hypothetical protein